MEGGKCRGVWGNEGGNGTLGRVVVMSPRMYEGNVNAIQEDANGYGEKAKANWRMSEGTLPLSTDVIISGPEASRREEGQPTKKVYGMDKKIVVRHTTLSDIYVYRLPCAPSLFSGWRDR